MLTLELRNGELKLENLVGIVMNSNAGKNLMGRDFLTYSVKFTEVSDQTTDSIKRFIDGSA